MEATRTVPGPAPSLAPLNNLTTLVESIAVMADRILSGAPRADDGACAEAIKALAEKAQGAIEAAQRPGDAVVREDTAERAEAFPAITIPGRLASLGREAVWEIAALAQAIVEHYGQLRDEDQRPLVVRGMALRVHELNNRVMSILDVPEEVAAGSNARELQRVILGEAAAGIGAVE